ncbi:unnamed protein product, partial [Ixodes persulcatus]
MCPCSSLRWHSIELTRPSTMNCDSLRTVNPPQCRRIVRRSSIVPGSCGCGQKPSSFKG